jgi:hypothetical protein
VLFEVVVGGGREAGGFGAAKVDRDAIGLLVAKSGQDALAVSHKQSSLS